MQQAWQVKAKERNGIVEDIRFFESEVEADEFAKMALAWGATAQITPIPLPKTIKEFVCFLEDRLGTVE